jgi:tetratricopeptide (TPR) repeat protein
MRFALVIAPSDSRSGDAALRREALAWLRGRLARFGFHVVIVGGAQDPQADIDRAIARVSDGDTVLVHISGRLADRDAIAFGDAGLITLGSLTQALANRSPAHVSFVLELTHEEDENDALLAAEILETTLFALRAKPFGYPVLAAVRPLAMAVDRVAFTRLALPQISEHSGPPPTEAIVASMYEAASATEESRAVAQSFTFSRGAASLLPPPPGSAYGRASAVYSNGRSPEIVEPVADDAIEAVHEVAPASGPVSSSELSIHSLIAEATEMCDWPRALELRRQRLHELASPRQKSKELVAIARILQVEFGDSDGAIEALEMARAMDPRRASVLQALRRGYERLGRWGNALEVTAALAELAESPVDRAKLHVACALVALERMGDPERAVAWFDAALTADPANRDALDALGQLRTPHAPIAPSLAPDPAPAFVPPQALPPAVTPAIPGPMPRPAAVRTPAPEPDATAHERTADRLLAEGIYDAGLEELESAALLEPMRVSIYEKSFAAHRRAGRTDAALLSAFALEALDAADVDEQVLIDQFRSVAPTRVRSALDDAAWDDLRAPGSDAVLTALFASIEGAAIAARMDELREQRKLAPLDPAERLSEASTASIGRTFQWAARVLSVSCPHLYVRDDVPGGIASIPAREPSTGLGPSVVSGMSAKDLAFLVGRHLTYYRPGHQVLLHYPSRDELATLLLAAAQVAMPKAASQSDDVAVRTLRGRLARHLGTEERAALDRAVRELDKRGGNAALGAWMCSVELTASRAGLLLAGDLATATSQLRAESRDAGHVPLDVRLGDAIAFCASRAHAAMRAQFAMTAPESLHPSPLPAPPPSSSSLQIGP